MAESVVQALLVLQNKYDVKCGEFDEIFNAADILARQAEIQKDVTAELSSQLAATRAQLLARAEEKFAHEKTTAENAKLRAEVHGPCSRAPSTTPSFGCLCRKWCPLLPTATVSLRLSIYPQTAPTTG